MSRNPFPKNGPGRKNLMAVTGLFLCLFLVVHLAGNLQLLLPPDRARLQYNLYSEMLSHNILIKIISYALYLSILAHAIYAWILTRQSQKARGGQAYVFDRRGQASSWYRRSMGILGALLLVFIVIHMKDFWFQYKFGHMPVDEAGRKDLYAIVVAAYQQGWYVALYVVAMLVLGFHLLHGFNSAFQTIGLYHRKYSRWMKVAGQVYTALITAGFVVIPIYLYIQQNHILT